MKKLTVVVIIVSLSGCLEPPKFPEDTPTKPNPIPSDAKVPDGYGTFAWGATKKAVTARYGDLEPGTTGNILFHDTKIGTHPGKEAFFFDKADGLVEVELKVSPKISEEKAAELALHYDTKFGLHTVTRADEDRYQFAWSGAVTDVYFTYDLTEKIPDAPILTFVPHAERATPTLEPAGPPEQFAEDGMAAFVTGWFLVDAVVGSGRASLIVGQGDKRKRLTVFLEAGTGRVIGYESGDNAVSKRETPAAEAETAIKVRLTTVGGPHRAIVKKGILYLIFSDGSYVALKPGASKLFVSAGGDTPEDLVP